MSLRIAFLACMVASICFADTLRLKDGTVVQGTYLGGTSRQIRMLVGDTSRTYEVSEISSLQFGDAAAPQAAAQQPAPAQAAVAAARQPEGILRPERAPAAPAQPAKAALELPAGTQLVVRMIDDVDSQRDTVGQTFRASLDEPVMIDGRVAVPRGADVVAKLVDDKQSGRVTGRTELTLDLVSLMVDGRMMDINTQEVTTQSESRTAQSAKVVGGTAALGAVIGAIAGGGRGAAIGAASGAGAGTAVQVLTKGQRVRIPSETRLQFTLEHAVKL
ncbi:MAG: hypothetical protein ACK5AZ_10715 [Bryobacteraceae bacterium]